MIGATFCSGIGAPEVSAPWVDWRLASEIEKFPRAVLQERFGYKTPKDHNQGDPLLWGDMTEVTPDLMRARGVPLPDLIVAGTPCQAFSIAGLRRGTDDDRGNLTLKFVEICHAIVDARPDGRLAVLWENVPGVLSDKGNAFGCFLGGLVGSDDPLPSPDGGSWPGAGMVSGPRARIAWRVLDAQYFGVAQRRRRVFAVVDFGNCVDPAAILFEPQGLRGNTPPSREAGQAVAGTLSARIEGGGGLGTDLELTGGLRPWPAEVAPTLNAHFGDKMGLEDQHAMNGAGLFVPEVSMCLNAGAMGRQCPETETLIPVLGKFDFGVWRCSACGEVFEDRYATSPQAADSIAPPECDRCGNEDGNAWVSGGCLSAKSATGDRTHALTGEGHDASEDGTGRGTPVVAFSSKDYGADAISDLSPTLRAGGHAGSHQNGGVMPAVAFDLRGRDGGAMPEGPHDTANIRAANGGSSRSYVTAPAVRRLTPVECARLQGFPDDHCAITYRGKPAADGPQYKAYGNSMAVPVVRWILDRLRASFEAGS